jgi:hypothetical protein
MVCIFNVGLDTPNISSSSPEYTATEWGARDMIPEAEISGVIPGGFWPGRDICLPVYFVIFPWYDNPMKYSSHIKPDGIFLSYLSSHNVFCQ